jgi:hypothetical protein
VIFIERRGRSLSGSAPFINFSRRMARQYSVLKKTLEFEPGLQTNRSLAAPLPRWWFWELFSTACASPVRESRRPVPFRPCEPRRVRSSRTPFDSAACSARRAFNRIVCKSLFRPTVVYLPDPATQIQNSAAIFTSLAVNEAFI